MGTSMFSVVNDIELPLSRNSSLIWIGYSEEGLLYTFDNEGIFRTLNPLNK